MMRERVILKRKRERVKEYLDLGESGFSNTLLLLCLPHMICLSEQGVSLLVRKGGVFHAELASQTRRYIARRTCWVEFVFAY